MPPKVVLTSRKVRNSDTGIDISVPSHDQAASPKLVKNYHVVVITSLPYFKSADHSEDAVVQFMAPREYEAFEQLQKDLLEGFPQLKLPSLPRKFHLFLKDTDIEERQIAFDCLMKVVCRDKDMCTSPAFLRFLGFDPLGDKTYFKRRREYMQTKDKESIQKNIAEATDVDASLFETDISVDKPQPSHAYGARSLFDDPTATEDTVRRGAKFPFLEDVFVPTEHAKETEMTEHSELLDVSVAINDVLQTVGTAKKGTLTHGLHGSNADNERSVKTAVVQEIDSGDMQSGDIARYIETHNTEKDDDLDLF